MTTRHLLHDAGHCLRAAAPPLLALSVLALAGTTQGEAAAPGGVGELLLVTWQTAMLATLLWLIVATVWAATRPLRDRRAVQRLQHLREIATVPDRALVHVQTIVCSSPAGQQVVVVNVMTGVTSRVWLPEANVPIGSFAVLERTDSGVRAVEWLNIHQVEAGHRHDARRVRPTAVSAQRPEHPGYPRVHNAAAELVRETEEFLRSQ